MIYIGTSEADGSAIYLDVYATERVGCGVRISGTVGDGHYEGEVLVEVGGRESVTFADAWLGGEGLTEFRQRCGGEGLERALLDAAQQLPMVALRRTLPHAGPAAGPPLWLAEPGPVWTERLNA